MGSTRFSRLLLATMVAGACGRFTYSGDGILRDSGSSAAIDRYVLDLGAVKSGATEYRIGPLPHTEFTIGLEAVGLSQEQALLDVDTPASALVEVSLTTDEGELKFHQSKPLREWIWSCGVGCTSAFGYLRQANTDPGTYFTPRDHQGFLLRVGIPESTFFAKHEVHVIARGGGWK